MGMHRHNRYYSIDYYACRSGLKEWNVSYKVFFSVMALITVIAADSIVLSVMTMLFMGGLTCIVGKLKVMNYMGLLSVPLAFIIMSGIAVGVLFGSGKESIFCIPFFSGYAYITKLSLRLAVSLSLKAFGAISCLFLLTLSTPMGDILSVFKRIHIPAIILELMHFIYRYIFILLDINSRQKDAVRSRLGYCDKKTALRSFGCELANLLIVSMGKSQDYYDALISRGGNDNYLFWEEKRRISVGQILYGAAYLLLVVVLLKG